MKLLDKLVLKDLMPMFLVGVGMFFALYFAGDPIIMASRFLAQGVALRLVLELVLLKVPIILALVFPMGMLFAVLIGFGRLSAESEAVAAFAAGIPFMRIVAPAIVLGVIASVVGYFLSDEGSTWANRRFNDIRAHSFNAVADTDKPIDPPPKRSGDVLQAIVHIEHGIDVRTGMLRDVTITTFDAHGSPTAIFHAKTARWMGDWATLNWQLNDVEVDYVKPIMSKAYMPTMRTRDLTQTPETILFLATDASSLSFQDLRRQIVLLRAEGAGHMDDVRAAELQMWRIIALPLASLVFAVVGAPLGLRPQRTAKFTGWGLAILIIFGYYVMYTVTGSMSDGGSISPFLGAFAPDFVGLAIGGALLVRAAN